VSPFELRAALLAVAMFAGLLACVELGRWFGVRRRRSGEPHEETSGSAIDASVFALFGLLVAFSFSGALDRFDHRRTLIVGEAKAIGTAYQRLDLLPAGSQPALRALFREYVRSRLAYYRKMAEPELARGEREQVLALQGAIWTQAMDAARATGNTAVVTLVGAGLAAVSEAEVERIAALRRHPPPIIFGMLFLVGFASAFLAGHTTAGKARNWPRVVVFSASLAVAVLVIINLEYPRYGFILGDADQPLVEVLERMR
jgi:hypothetical protein